MSVMEEKNAKPDKSESSVYSTRSPGFVQLPKMPKMLVKKSPHRTWAARSLLLVIACLIAGFGGGWLGAKQYSHGGILNSSDVKAKAQYISTESQLVAQIAKDVGQSVVSVNVS